jgi:hypothetical protein
MSGLQEIFRAPAYLTFLFPAKREERNHGRPSHRPCRLRS